MDQKAFSSFLQDWIPKHKGEIVSSLLELIAIPSTEGPAGDGEPFGPEVARAFDMYLEKARNFGMSVTTVNGYAVHAEIGSGAEMAMALTHADIVPFGTGWARNPRGEVYDAKIYGRGAQDNKGPTIACLYALRAIKESGAPLNRRIRHVVGGNEESGFRCVRHYFEVEEKPTYGFSPDAEFPLVFAEKGNMKVKVTAIVRKGTYSLVYLCGGERPNIVPEKARAVITVPEGQESTVIHRLENHIPEIKSLVAGPGPLSFEFTPGPGQIAIECRGKASHASVPQQGTNAVAAMLYLFSCLGEDLGSWKSIRFVAEASDICGNGLRIKCQDDVSGKLSCNLGVCKTSESDGNKILTGIYDIRYPVKISSEKLRTRTLESNESAPGEVRVEVISLGKPHYTDPDSFLVKTLLQIYREETGDSLPPIAIGGGTYAKVIPGGVAYGPARPGDVEVVHQADEFISIDNLLLLVKIYARALYALAQ